MNNRRRNALLMILVGIVLPLAVILLGVLFDSSGFNTILPGLVSVFIGAVLIVLGFFRLAKLASKK